MPSPVCQAKGFLRLVDDGTLRLDDGERTNGVTHPRSVATKGVRDSPMDLQAVAKGSGAKGKCSRSRGAQLASRRAAKPPG